MATVKKLEGKSGISYKITVSSGRDSTGKQIRHYKTWTPPAGMSPTRADKEALKVAIQFENELEQGFQTDKKWTFTDYANYVIALKENNGAKHNTVRGYRDLLRRIDQAFGNVKLIDLRPQHLNRFYKSLQDPNARLSIVKAKGRPDLAEKIKAAGMTREALGKAASVSHTTITQACRGEAINGEKVGAIAGVLNRPVKDLFDLSKNCKPLSNKTVLEYHRFIHAVLSQAEKEMLVPYNAASKATPPSVPRKTPNYFQPEEITAILEALDMEPEKWRVLAHLWVQAWRSCRIEMGPCRPGSWAIRDQCEPLLFKRAWYI